MKILVILILPGLVYQYRWGIIKMIAAVAVALFALKSFGIYLVAIILTLAPWAGLFWFIGLVVEDP